MDRRLVLALLLIAAPLHANEAGWSLDALRGLKRMAVVVDPLSHDARREGLRASALAADAELRLRRAGIAVVTDRLEAAATLRVHLDHMLRDLDSGAVHEFRLRLDVVQTAQLARDPAVEAGRPVWTKTVSGTHLTTMLIPAVRDALRRLQEQLIDDLLTANEGAIGRPPKVLPRLRPEGD